MTQPFALLDVAERLTRALQEAARSALGTELPDLVLAEPPKPGMGDFAVSACLPLARVLGRPPRDIARAVVDALPSVDGVDRLEIAGPGYLNVHLDRPAFAAALLRQLQGDPPPPATIHDARRVDADRPKVIVEHTNINPNKAAHVGHLRNAVLGDTLVRLLQHAGTPVEVQNYIDDTGVQVADVVVGFTAMEGRSPAEAGRCVDELLADPSVPFDHACWDVYAAVSRWYADDDDRLEHRREALHAMESGEGALAELGARIADAVMRRHLATMARIGVRYHLLPRESDILASRFWAEAFERMKAAGAVHLADQGKNSGCWVMPLTDAEEFKGLEDPDKVIVRANGTVTYVGKDIAFQMWKFGLLGADFRYSLLDDPSASGHALWQTDTAGGSAEGHPPFGHGSTVYNVIDVRQSYLQAIVQQALRLVGHGSEAERSVHYGYEMVALTPATAEALGFTITDEDRRAAHVEMSGRRGLGVKADDLLDRLEAEARGRVATTNRERELGLSEEEIDHTARQVAVGALRYYMLKITRNRVIAFDIDEALQFQGEAGPYLQYSAVRAANIFRKLERDGRLPDDAAAALEASGALLQDEGTWALVMAAARLPEIVRRSCESLEVAHVARHGFLLGQAWNAFYKDNTILHAESAELRGGRAGIARIFLLTLRQLLGLLGIPEPERM